MQSYLLSHVAAVLGAIAAFTMLVRPSGTRRTPQSTMAWLVALLFVPLVAIPLFLLLGTRKFPRLAKGPDSPRRVEHSGWDDAGLPHVARVLRGSGVAPPRHGNSFELLPTGEAAYAKLMALVGDAQKSIDLTMFILGDDTTGHAVVDALAARAKAGVSIRVILDAVGCARSKRHACAKLKATGVDVRMFMPLAHSPVRGRTNLRSHRKLAVFDRQHVFAGGMNLANEYMGPPGETKTRWRDVSAVSSGPVAIDAEAMFESDWLYCGGAPRQPPTVPPVKVEGVDATVQIVPSGPDLVSDTVYDLFLQAIFNARERVVLVTPYYVPDDFLQHALVLAARRGVRTEVVVPTFSNHRVADVARRSLLAELLGAGVHLRYYAHGMVHAKAMVVDDTFAYVGSPNFDMRSLFLNYEDAVCVYSPGAIGQIRGFVDALMAECDTAGPPVRRGRLVDQIALFLAPEL